MPINQPVTICLLNYRGAEDTLACVASLQQLTYPNYQIVVVDNASPDDSVQRLKASPFAFKLIESPINGGFSAGNNIAIRHALETTPDKQGYVWILNNDTTVAPDSLTMLVAEAEKSGGIAGSLLLYPDGSYQQAGTVINWWTGQARGIREGRAKDGMSIPCLSGASMLVPLNVFEKMGMMAEPYFLYFEDCEFCLRAERHGIPRTLAIQSRVFHKEGATTGRKSLPTQYYYHRNRLKVLFQYANPLQKTSIGLYTVFRLLRTMVKCLLSAFSRKSAEKRQSARVQWIATLDFLKGIEGPCPHQLN